LRLYEVEVDLLGDLLVEGEADDCMVKYGQLINRRGRLSSSCLEFVNKKHGKNPLI
jgi:hypothetical protein